ncbi:uncharacterized protein METZ01_LOCUS300805, partial [marine metagenome]
MTEVTIFIAASVRSSAGIICAPASANMSLAKSTLVPSNLTTIGKSI